MESPNEEGLLIVGNETAQHINSQLSSRTISPTQRSSETTSTHEKSSSASECPSPELINSCAQSCRGLWNGCAYGEHHQRHCRLRCSPRSCRQCREVGDSDWIQRGQWLEDCVSWDEEDEDEYQHAERDLPPRRQEVSTVIAVSAFVVFSATILYWNYRTLRISEILQTMRQPFW